MKLAKVTGRVVCTKKLDCLDGLKLLLLTPVDEYGKVGGTPLVAYDLAQAGEGDIIWYESGKEAAQACPNGWFNPLDAVVLGIVDSVNTGVSR